MRCHKWRLLAFSSYAVLPPDRLEDPGITPNDHISFLAKRRYEQDHSLTKLEGSTYSRINNGFLYYRDGGAKVPFQSAQAFVQRILDVNPFLQARSLRIKIDYHLNILLCMLGRIFVHRLNWLFLLDQRRDGSSSRS